MKSNIISGRELDRWYRQAKQTAIANEIAADEVTWLLQTVTDLDSLSLRLATFQNRAQITSTKSLSELTELWQQRLRERLPVQYLVETVFWRRFQLKVTPAVLIPRPETELIIELVKKYNVIEPSGGHWVDLGTGSGAIALGLAELFPQATIHGVDISSEALKVARENVINLNYNNIRLYRGSWWNPLTFLRGKVTGVISNPPYIPTAQINDLQPEVARHEPRVALDGGDDGLRDIRCLIEVTPQYLVSRGILLLEIMVGQAGAVIELLQREEYFGVRSCLDLNGIERFVMAYRR